MILPNYKIKEAFVVCSVNYEQIKFQKDNYFLIKTQNINPNKCIMDNNLTNILNICVDKIYTLFLSVSDYLIIILDLERQDQNLKLLRKSKICHVSFIIKKKQKIYQIYIL
jgi:hypothetical protein